MRRTGKWKAERCLELQADRAADERRWHGSAKGLMLLIAGSRDQRGAESDCVFPLAKDDRACQLHRQHHVRCALRSVSTESLARDGCENQDSESGMDHCGDIGGCGGDARDLDFARSIERAIMSRGALHKTRLWPA